MRLLRRRPADPYRLGLGDRAEFMVPLLIGLLVAILLLLGVVFHFGAGVS
jgi:hypothetical protein